MKFSPFFIALNLCYLLSSCKEQSTPVNSGTDPVNSTSQVNNPTEENEGKKMYEKYCLACHQADGSGVPKIFPPLIQSPMINSGNKKQLVSILLHGLKGPIEVNGQHYDQQMPRQDFLSNEQISQIINYISFSFKNSGSQVSPAEVDSIRNIAP